MLFQYQSGNPCRRLGISFAGKWVVVGVGVGERKKAANRGGALKKS
jgi:hypothetical protein